jgi:hypothetical protein
LFLFFLGLHPLLDTNNKKLVSFIKLFEMDGSNNNNNNDNDDGDNDDNGDDDDDNNNNIDSIDNCIENENELERIYQQMFQVNCMANIYLTHFALPFMKSKTSCSHLCVMSSISGLIPIPMRTAYCMSKSALESFFKTLAGNVIIS